MDKTLGALVGAKTPLLFFISFLILLCSFHKVQATILYIHPSDSICEGHSPCFASYNLAQATAEEGDSLFLFNGTYLSEGGLAVLAITKSVHIIGESVSGVIIEASSSAEWGIWVGAPAVSIRNLTIQYASGFGLVNESGQSDGLVLDSLVVKENNKTGIALRNISGATLKNLSISNNMGNALSLTSVSDIVVDNIQSFGNQFQTFNGFTASIGVFSTREDGVSSDIDIQGTLDIAEPVCVYLHPGPIDTANILTNPPEEITAITVPDSLYAVVGVDVPIILNNPALPNQNFGGVMGADALYFFKDMTVASTCAEVAARENDGILEPYIFLYDRNTGERSLLPNITSNPQDLSYNGSRSVQFKAKVSDKSARSGELRGSWEISIDNGIGWEPLEEGPPYMGTHTTTLTVSPFSLEMDDYQFRFVASNQWGNDTSEVAIVEVPEAFLTCSFRPNLYCPQDSVVETSHYYSPRDTLYGFARAESGCAGIIASLYYVDEDFRSPGNLEGDYLRTWIATDELGNRDSCGQWITFMYEPLAVSQADFLDTPPAFHLYPNPVKKKFHLLALGPHIQAYDLIITDAMGKSVYREEGIRTTHKHTIEQEDWMPGVYWIQVLPKDFPRQTYQILVSP